jgi:hypothetical protein
VVRTLHLVASLVEVVGDLAVPLTHQGR